MDKEEYKKALSDIKAQADEKIRELAFKYVEENRTYQSGEIISDGNTIIKITGVRVIVNKYEYDVPTYYYIGKQLTKKLEPRKDGAIGAVFPDRVK